ncbi:hypothetical protein [Burkholderia sp. NLJ2]|uniref:hypothetical protein n=1 Tax=Burkholderia sp. NLJ2 TaxID=3090699 RepID=UPI003C6C7467
MICENISEGNDALVDGHHLRALEEIASEIVVGIRGVAAKAAIRATSGWATSDMTPASIVRCPASTCAGWTTYARLGAPSQLTGTAQALGVA